jgi:hypothetical protein
MDGWMIDKPEGPRTDGREESLSCGVEEKWRMRSRRLDYIL